MVFAVGAKLLLVSRNDDFYLYIPLLVLIMVPYVLLEFTAQEWWKE